MWQVSIYFYVDSANPVTTAATNYDFFHLIKSNLDVFLI